VLGQLVDDERRRLAQNVAPRHPRIAVGSRPLSPDPGARTDSERRFQLGVARSVFGREPLPMDITHVRLGGGPVVVCG
jgi:hypothetical protein